MLDPAHPLHRRARATTLANDTARDSAHDWSHVLRVANLADRLAREEGGDVDVAVGAALLHELVNLPKDHPESHQSGDRCAVAARALLVDLGWPDDRCDAVAACIAAHGWSKGAAPPSLEAAVLQDADRLDAIGAIGVARCFATAGSMRSALYAEQDPLCTSRIPEDRRYAVDHFRKKLLLLSE
jgi:uncharacterized protein